MAACVRLSTRPRRAACTWSIAFCDEGASDGSRGATFFCSFFLLFRRRILALSFHIRPLFCSIVRARPSLCSRGMPVTLLSYFIRSLQACAGNRVVCRLDHRAHFAAAPAQSRRDFADTSSRLRRHFAAASAALRASFAPPARRGAAVECRWSCAAATR
jgi:hypothetical protein